MVEGVDAAGFTAVVEADLAAGKTIDVVIGGNATTKLLTAYDDTVANASCNIQHFDSDNRKAIVLQQAASTHVELAKQLYAFLMAAPAEYKLQVMFWTKEYSWVT